MAATEIKIGTPELRVLDKSPWATMLAGLAQVIKESGLYPEEMPEESFEILESRAFE
ncbi:MAG TPA: hypothetical protein VKK79_18395 [Candidatus Lokiarchaeia archaeon]|nr:hypothetical protein [Candidatus Lokiarchaeia archaeon]